MPAPISPSCAAFSSTSDGMLFWASASAVARPPMPPPAMRILRSWATHDLLVMQPGYFVRRQAEDTRQDFVRMLAEHRRGLRCLAWRSAELQRRGGDRIPPDARLVEHGEHRVVEHGLAILTELAERLVGRP